MKLINVGNHLINLDKIIFVTLEDRTIYLYDKHTITLDQEELDDFIYKYNLIDTDETKILNERIANILLSNPEYMTRAGIIEQIVLKAKYKNLEKFVKGLTGDKKLKELSPGKLIEVYRQLRDKIKDLEADLPY